MTRALIGLALGSGAARGWAHIGVLKALKDAGIKPDILCGTSMGALVGGVHLAGHLDALETWVCKLGRLGILRYLDFRMSGGGLIGGDRLLGLLHQNLGDTTIEELTIPFAAVATDLKTGHEVWLQQGRVIDAIRASFALPGLFTPLKVNGNWLVDGALANPVPVSVCHALGARIVIAVNLNADLIGKHCNGGASPLDSGAGSLGQLESLGSETGFTRGKPFLRRLFRTARDAPSVFNVMVASLNIIQDRLSRSRLAGDPPDVMLAPKLGQFGLLEFDRGQEIIEEGRAATERALADLRSALAVLG